MYSANFVPVVDISVEVSVVIVVVSSSIVGVSTMVVIDCDGDVVV